MKTIFVNLMSKVVIGNFSIPGGVLENLVKNKNKETKIVFLTDQSFMKFLKPYLFDDSIGIEFIKVIKPQGVIQKLFHFFYSYLIFTGTTRVLATFGARADIPPAGGNRHLAILKSFIANTFGRSKFIKTKTVSWLFKKILSSRPYKNIFEKYNPALVFLPNIAFFPDIEILAEAQRRGIKTVGMASNWDHLNKYFIPLRAGLMLVQNEPMLKEAVELQAYEKDKILVTGFPQFDPYARPERYIFPKEQFFEKFGIPLASRIILFISGAAYSLDEPDILKTISQWIKEGRFGLEKICLLVRPYVLVRDRAQEEEKYKAFKDDSNIFFNWLSGGENLENRQYYLSMLYYADVIISIFSTTAIEAAIFDKPIITIGFDGYKKRPPHQSITRLEKLSHFRHVLDTGSIRVARSFPNLFEILEQYLKFPQKDKEKREALIKKMCYKIDGRASERVAKFILENINDK